MLMRESDNSTVYDVAADPTPTERAEEMLARMERRVAPWTSNVRLSILRHAARVREEAEDMWAEAQSIREANARKQK